MSCAACQARVEKAVSKVPGVESCAVSLLTNSMGVEGTAAPEDVIKAVTDAGYGAALRSAGAAGAAGGTASQGSAGAGNRGRGYASIREQEEMLADTETPRLKKRLITSVGFLLLLMYISMGHGMLGWSLPAFMEGNHIAMAIAEMLLAAIVMLINKKFFTSGFKSLVHLAPNMDTLVAMGSMTSFVWSVVVLFKMTVDQLAGVADAVMTDMHNLYFESAAMIVTLITIGKMLEAMSKGRTTDALKSLMKLAPETATVLKDPNGQTVTAAALAAGAADAKYEEAVVPIEEVSVGDVCIVKSGDSVPVAGRILSGTAAIDESALTGESLPVDKAEGDEVSAATISRTGYFRAEATKIGEDTTLAKIIGMVNEAASTKAPIAKIADKVSGVFVPAVIGIAVLVTVIWLFLGRDVGFSLARGIAVLVISCPCALGLATPVAIMVGNGKAARNGILFKTSASLEETGRVQIVALDKTGTITSGKPVVTDLFAIDEDGDGVESEASGANKHYNHPDADELAEKYSSMINLNIYNLIKAAASLETKSEHPLARAIVDYAASLKIEAAETADFVVLPGNGLQAAVRASEIDEDWGGKTVTLYGGNRDMIAKIAAIPAEAEETAAEYAAQGKTPIYFAVSGLEAEAKLLGIIAVADAVKPDSRQAIEELHNMGIQVVMLTGDNEKTARVIGDQVGVDKGVAGVKPDGKESVIRQLKEYGKVAMVGDGINDAPALTRADIGIAIGAGTNVAIDAADVVLMNSGLGDAAAAVRLSRQTLRNIHQNLFWAFFYNVLLIPLAAGLYAHFMHGWTMNPMIGAAAMSLSSFCVCMNALRLNLFDPHDASHDKKRGGEIQIVMDTGDTDVPAEDNQSKEEKTMEKTMKIEGMMCVHCEARVKKTLEALDGVTEAVVSHETGTAVVKMDTEVADEVLKKAVEDQDYAVKGIA